MLMQETRGGGKLSAAQSAAWIGGLLAALLVLWVAVGAVIRWTGIGWLDILFFIGAALLLSAFTRARLLNCRYMLYETALQLERAYGRRPQAAIRVAWEDILALEPAEKPPRGAMRFVYGRAPMCCIRYREGAAQRAAVFQPSAAFSAELEKAMAAGLHKKAQA